MYYRYSFGVCHTIKASDREEARQKMYDFIKEELDFRFRDVIKARAEWKKAKEALKKVE